mmetsp:Transcript_5779/g.14431  ORF Transcript_5779/g.14431 Transcript_5779/m.14431 type:complete len:1212 (-) Transcript_5779:165-3800(-)
MKGVATFLFLVFFLVFVSAPPGVRGEQQEEEDLPLEGDDEASVWEQEYEDEYDNDEMYEDQVSTNTTTVQSSVANDASSVQNDSSLDESTAVNTIEDKTAFNCSLVGFLPFTSIDFDYRSYQLPRYGFSTRSDSSGIDPLQTTIYDSPDPPPYAVTHAAAAAMAMDHFNARQSVLVPELKNYTSNCSVMFDDLVWGNTNSMEGFTPKFLLNYYKENGTPCAVLGDYTNLATKEAGIISNGMGTVLVSHGADESKLTSPRNPGVTRTVADQHPNGEAIVSWLRSKERTDFLSILYTSHEHGLAYADTIKTAAKETTFNYLLREKITPPYVGEETNMIRPALRSIKDSSYKTIVAAINMYQREQLPLIADAAEEFGLNSPDYVWVFVLPMEQNLDEFVLYSTATEQNPNITKLVNGSAIVRNLDPATLPNTPFDTLWKLNDGAFVERLNEMLNAAGVNEFAVSQDYFRQYRAEAGAGYMYDAVMAIGMGKCQELKRKALGGSVKGGFGGNGGGGGEEGNAQGGGKGGQGDGQTQRALVAGAYGSRGSRYANLGESIDSDRRHRRAKGGARPPPRHKLRRKLQKKEEVLGPHMEGITSLDFHGVTGRFIWKERRKRSRNRETMNWGVYNIRAIDPLEKERMEARFPGHNFTLWYYLTDILEGGPVDGKWKMTDKGPFLFADGTPLPPKLLRDPPEQNYLSFGWRVAGLTLMSISIFLTVLVTCLVIYYQFESIICHNQPFFLYIILLGTALLTFSIFFLSFDEAALGLAPEDPKPEFLDTACAFFPWFLSLGVILIYGALFMKLWRINRVLQCDRARRKTVGVKKVVWPVVVLLVTSVTVLATWTAIDPFHWERNPIDLSEPDGESYGQCTSPYQMVFIYILGAIMGSATVLTMIMAFKTKDIDRQFSESSWAFTTIVLQFQVLLVGIPILVIVQQQSAEATYMCRVMLIWTLSVSTVVLMFGPKLIPLLFPKFVARWNKETLRSSIGSNRGSVRVSGYPANIRSANTKSTRAFINGQQISHTHPALDFSSSHNTDHFTQPTMAGTAYTDDENPGIPTSARRIDKNDIEEVTNGDDDDDDYPGIRPSSLHSKSKDSAQLDKSQELDFNSSIQLHDSTFNESDNPGSAFIHPDMDESMTFGHDGDRIDCEEKKADQCDSEVLDSSMNFETAVEYEALPAPEAEPIKFRENTKPAATKKQKRTSKRDNQTTIQHRN